MIINVSHQKGGVGKSTIAFNIAIELSKTFKIKMIDLDTQETVTAYNRIRKIMGQSALKVHSFINDEEMIDFLNNQDENAIIIIDSGGFDSAMNRVAIAVSDFIITPVSADFTDILGLEMYSNIIKDVSDQINRNVTSHIVLTKVSPQQKYFHEVENFINASKYFHLMESRLCRRVDFATSVAHGFSVIELDDSSKSSEELTMLLNEIKTKAKIDG